jgi:hypothetical protein
MNFNRISKLLKTILPGIIVAGLIFGANLYYDLDLGRVIVNEITRIIGMFETTATTTLATVSGYVGIKTCNSDRSINSCWKYFSDWQFDNKRRTDYGCQC